MLDGFCEYLRQQGKSENTVKSYSQGMKATYGGMRKPLGSG